MTDDKHWRMPKRAALWAVIWFFAAVGLMLLLLVLGVIAVGTAIGAVVW